MNKLFIAAIATAVAGFAAPAFAVDADNNGIDDEAEAKVAATMMELIDAGMISPSAETLPGYIVTFADKDNDGVLNDSELRRALDRLKRSMDK